MRGKCRAGKRVNIGHWRDRNNRESYCRRLAAYLAIEKPEDWYRVTVSDFTKTGGNSLLQRYYSNSPCLFVEDVAGVKDLKPWLYGRAPFSCWADVENHRQYATWLGQLLGFKKPEDWYSIRREDLLQNSGSGLLEYYKNSPYLFVSTIFEKYEFHPWLFPSLPFDGWSDIGMHRRYFRWLGSTLGFTKIEDWYKLNRKCFLDNSGAALLGNYYHNSPYLFLETMLPEHDWVPWLFQKTPQGYWQNKEHHRHYMDWLTQELNITDRDDWYRVSIRDFWTHRGHGLLAQYAGSPSECIKTIIGGEWDETRFLQIYKGQARLFDVVSQIFPRHEILQNAKFLKSSITGRKLELDIYLPERKLAFEYQGEQHYFPIDWWGGEESHEATQRNDAEKKRLCKEQGILLIRIRYDWDGTHELIKRKLAKRGFQP